MSHSNRRLRRPTVAAVCLLGLAAAPVAATAVAGAATTRQVSVKDTFFQSKRLTIDRGDTVRWVWKGDLGHDVYFKSKSVQPRSKEMRRTMTSGSYRLTFKKAGTYRYICTVHVGDRMQGTIVVK
jgi:plastocyanin